jgi:fused signal recognition particle receptor
MLGFFKASFQKVKEALTKTRSFLGQRLKNLFNRPWNEETFDEFEQILYEADLGSFTVSDFIKEVRQLLRKNPEAPSEEILNILRQKALDILKQPPRISVRPVPENEPKIVLIVGVNGSGKTTSIAKLANVYKEQGKKVMVAAADTFRAAAIEQLQTWAERLKIDIVKGLSNSDPSAVVFDALSAAKARGCDIVLIDTAGRLQNKTDLMQELEKIKRVCHKVVPNSPHETLLVLDATVGQNAVDQANIFNQYTPLSGIVLTKIDGSAKGGIVLSIYKELGVPVQWLGIGEKALDLTPFDPEQYVNALFE